MSEPTDPGAEPAATRCVEPPSIVKNVVGVEPVFTVSRELALSVLGEVQGHVSWEVLNRLGRLFRSPLAYLSDEARNRLRQQVLSEMLENKRALIVRLREQLARATTEDERERCASELYAWLQEDARERLAQQQAAQQPGGGAAAVVAVGPCDAGCIDLLARVIYAEAAAEGDGVMAAMGWVVVNRVRDTTHEFRNLNTCEAVIRQPGAFSSVGGTLWNQVDSLPATGPAREAYDRARAVARRICAGELPDPTRGALLYYSPRAMDPAGSQPRWRFDQLEEVTIPGVTNGDNGAVRLYRYR